MSHSTDNLSDAGKITVLTSFIGVLIFVGIFLLNLGGDKVDYADAADTATTSVTVVNTPPVWTVDAGEEFESSTTSPNDAGTIISWTAVGTDANSERYYLLICKTAASPTPNANAAPACDSGANQWAVTASTTSGSQAQAATTTQDGWAESNDWYAWVCDGNATNPRCSTSYTQGHNATSSPFSVNHRPSFSLFADSSPGDPGTVVTFYSTSSDSDVDGAADTVRLFICNDPDFSTSTNDCGAGGTIASTSGYVASNASATYSIVIPTQDQDYTAYGYVIDNHGFEASGGAHGTDSTLSVNNVAPTVTPGGISINGGSNMVLSVAAGQTTGYTLQFTAADNNSCQTAASTSEITSYVASIYRSGIGEVTCDGTAGAYNPNNCYTSGSPTTTWNLSCEWDDTSCTGAIDTASVFNCTFPLWYVADPTDGTATSTQYPTEDWMAAIKAVDDDYATGTIATSTTGVGRVDVGSFLAFALNTLTIPYGSLEPGQQTDPIVATTTVSATGNLGIDQNLSGESMCPTYATGFDCPNSATSTIPESEQVYGTSTVSYAAGVALSSTTVTELELNGPKSTSTTTPSTANTFWGIRIPGTISFAGSYTGENTFYAVAGEASHW